MTILRLCTIVLFLLCTSVTAKTILFTNANGYTLTGEPGTDAQLKQFNTLLIINGKVAAVGDYEQLTKRLNLADITNQINLQGKTILPGLIDAHGHVLGLGQNLMQADLRDAASETAAVATVNNFAKQNPQLEWVIGRGWNQENWPNKEFPQRNSLDEAITDRPVYLTRVDGHAAWANSKALELAGITAATVSPEGGDIIRDSNGEPTGVLIDNAMALIEQKLPAASIEQTKQALQLAFDHLLAQGITSVHDAGIDALNLKAYQDLAAQNMPLRVYAMLSGSEPKLAELLAQGAIVSDDDKLTVRSVKIYADGALGSRGAALLEPYSDSPHQHGLMVTSQEDMRALYQLIIPHGFQINTHAIGDRANLSC